MSKKTEAIYKAITNLERLNEKLAKNIAEPDCRELEDINYEQARQLKELKFWIESLYLYTGKSTSNAKRKASKENGKKGGRPPKIITQMKNRVKELEVVIHDLEHNLRLSDDNEMIQKYENELALARNELEEVMKKVGER